MAYTASDLTAVRTAIVKLAQGQTRVSISFSSASGSRMVTYKSPDLGELRRLEMDIAAALDSAVSPRSRTVLTRSRKGL